MYIPMMTTELCNILYETWTAPTEQELNQMYHDGGMTMQEIANVFNASPSLISQRMKKYGIKARNVGKRKKKCTTHKTKRTIHTVDKRYSGLKPPKNKLEEMYWTNQMSMPEIADEMGVGQATVFDWMKSYDIKSRTISESTIGKLAGENSPHWKGGISFEPYCGKFNSGFKEAVRERDDYTCQLCGHEQLFNGKKLDVHHVHYDKENCYPDVVALCRSCNAKVNFDRDHWEKYFEEQLIIRGLLNWSISQET